jgi:hypothetical protein
MAFNVSSLLPVHPEEKPKMRLSVLATSAVLVAGAILGGCAGVQKFNAADEAIAAATQEMKGAKAANNVWSNTEKMLADAKTARENFRADEALKLAKQARDEAKLAQAQARDEADAKPFFNGQ